jgi:hypothetical protein
MRSLNRHHNEKLIELKQLLNSVGVNTKNTNTYSNLRRKAENEFYHNFWYAGGISVFIRHAALIKKLQNAINKRRIVKKERNLSTLESYKQPLSLSYHGSNRPSINPARNLENAKIRRREKIEEILSRYNLSDPNFKKYRTHPGFKQYWP